VRGASEKQYEERKMSLGDTSNNCSWAIIRVDSCDLSAGVSYGSKREKGAGRDAFASFSDDVHDEKRASVPTLALQNDWAVSPAKRPGSSLNFLLDKSGHRTNPLPQQAPTMQDTSALIRDRLQHHFDRTGSAEVWCPDLRRSRFAAWP